MQWREKMNCNCKLKNCTGCFWGASTLVVTTIEECPYVQCIYMRVRDCAHASARDCATAVMTVVVLQEFLLCCGLCLSACNLFITVTPPTPAAKCPLCKVLYTYVKATLDVSNMPQLQTMQRQSDEFCRVAVCEITVAPHDTAWLRRGYWNHVQKE